METLDQFRRLEVREKERNAFVMSLRLSDDNALYNVPSSSSFFDFARIFSCFFHSYFVLPIVLEFKEFNKTIIPFVLVGYETGYSNSALRVNTRWLFSISYPTRAHGIFVT